MKRTSFLARRVFSRSTLAMAIGLWFFSTAPLDAATSASQYGITWTFAKDYTVGQYANGDYWVLVDPTDLNVTITSISPASVVLPARVFLDGSNRASTVNGSMINPAASTSAKQGFDDGLEAGSGTSETWDASLNVARPGGNDLSAGNPLVITAGKSLVSSISNPIGNTRPGLTDAAVLTVVGTAPAAGAFRPPYAGTDKSGTWNEANLDYGILLALPQPAGAPLLTTVENYVQRPWIEINTSHKGRYFHPSNNQQEYGRDMAYQMSDALLTLHLNYTNTAKKKLFVRIIQYGIDVYGAAKSGGVWECNCGYNMGRKMPLILAGLALNDSNILAWGDASQHFIFQEDQQTFYVVQSDVGRTLVDETSQGRFHIPFIQADVGKADWGEKHFGTPNRDGRNFDTFYRDQNALSLLAHALTARLTKGAVAAWNWPAFFDYMDRHYMVTTNWSYATYGDLVGDPANAAAGWSPPGYVTFHKNMWAAYRKLAGPAPVAPSTLTVGP